MEIDSALALITAITSFTTAIVLILTYRQDKKRDKPQFELTAVYGGHPPDRKPIGIHIQNPNKPINKCQVFCNGIVLNARFGVNLRQWIYIHAGGAGDFILADNLTDIDNAIIEVKDGKTSIYPKTKLKDIPYPI